MVQEKQLKELFKYIEQNWDVCVEDVDKRDIKRIFGGVLCEDIMNDTDQVTDQEPEQVTEHEQTQPEMCESDAIDYILTNKLNWKKLGDNRMFAIGFGRTGASFRVSFVEYNHTLSGTRDVIINNIDLSEWQPVDTSIKPTEQPGKPSSQVILDNSFDRDRFEAMFRAVVASGRTERWEQDFKFTEEALAKLDAYYAEKEKGGNNG